MRKIATLAATALVVLGCSFTTGSDSQQSEWESLFDGKTLKGWHVYGHKQNITTWKVADGAIYFDPSGKRLDGSKVSNDLVSDKSYENFHLKYDWKIAKNGNSGLIFWVQEDSIKYKHTFHTGPEMQVIDNDGHADGKIEKHRAGNLYDLVAGKEGAVKPAGEWNTAEVICNRGKMEFILNGVSILTTNYGDENWKNMVANSKFKSMADFAKVFGGKFALQDHGDEVWFKNIMVKKL